MSAANPLLSIVLFCRNCAATLEQAIASVISQANGVELLVLDGGSSDGSVEIIQKYDRQIDYWRSREDGSSTNAIVEGVSRARGRVIGLLAGDDWYEPNTLASVISRFEEDKDLTVLSCGTRFAFFDDSGRLVSEKCFVDPEKLAFSLSNLFRDPLTCGRFISKAAYESLGGYSASFKSSDDLDFLVRLCLTRPKSAVHPQVTYTYRAHRGSRTLGGDVRILLAMARDNVAIAEKYLPSHSLTRPERSALLTMHGKFVARGVWYAIRTLRLLEAVALARRGFAKNLAWPIMIGWWLISRSARVRNVS